MYLGIMSLFNTVSSSFDSAIPIMCGSIVWLTTPPPPPPPPRAARGWKAISPWKPGGRYQISSEIPGVLTGKWLKSVVFRHKNVQKGSYPRDFTPWQNEVPGVGTNLFVKARGLPGGGGKPENWTTHYTYSKNELLWYVDTWAKTKFA